MLAEWSKHLLRLGVTLTLMAAIVTLARLPIGQPATHGVLRIVVRAVGEAETACRPTTESELAEMPVHMRQPEICERRVAPYHLHADLNGQTKVDRPVTPSGLHGDRPLVADTAMELAPGTYDLAVRFSPATTEAPGKTAIWNGQAKVVTGYSTILALHRLESGFQLRVPQPAKAR